MFGEKRYMTRGINAELPMALIIFLWARIDELKEESKGNMDYLQVFDLIAIDDPGIIENQMIIHRTEVPEYSRSHAVTVEKPIIDKVYVIDSINHSTMLFAREY